MIRPGHKLEIFNPVVGFHTIFMVDNLFSGKHYAKMFLHDKALLEDVALRVATTVVMCFYHIVPGFFIKIASTFPHRILGAFIHLVTFFEMRSSRICLGMPCQRLPYLYRGKSVAFFRPESSVSFLETLKSFRHVKFLFGVI